MICLHAQNLPHVAIKVPLFLNGTLLKEGYGYTQIRGFFATLILQAHHKPSQDSNGSENKGTSKPHNQVMHTQANVLPRCSHST